MSFGVAIFIIGNLIQITASNSWIHMMMGRFVAGLGVGNLSVGVPMFQSESSPKEIRGAVVASYQLMITIGILVSNLINYGTRTIEDSSASWRIVIGLGILFSLPLGLGILIVPESPRWLAGRGDWDAARMALARLRGLKHNPSHSTVEDDLHEMRQILEKERHVGSGSWLECFTPSPDTPKVVYRTMLGIGIHFLQQWTGINYFFYYGATVFSSAGISDPILVQLILGAVNVVMTFYGLYVVEKYGRRWPLFLGAIWQALWLLVFASVGTANPPSTGSNTTGIIMIVSACMYIASFAGTWGPMAWVVIGETFPLRTRAKQASLATAGNWLGNCELNPVCVPSASARLTTGLTQSSSASSRPWPPTVSRTASALSLSVPTLPPPSSSGSSSTSRAGSASSTSTSCTASPTSSRGAVAGGCRRATSRVSCVTMATPARRAPRAGRRWGLTASARRGRNMLDWGFHCWRFCADLSMTFGTVGKHGVVYC